MKKIKNYLFVVFIFLGGCSTTEYVMYHPNVSPNSTAKAYQIDVNKCRMLAYQTIKMPSQRSYSRRNYRASSSSAPSLISIIDGYESARNSPMAIYKRSINNYVNSCLYSKGWVRKRVE